MPKPNQPKPRKRNQAQRNEGNREKSRQFSRHDSNHRNQNAPNRYGDADKVPMMFRAQIEGHGNVQYAADSTQANQWVHEWVEPWKQSDESEDLSEKPKTQLSKALQRFQANQPQYQLKIPKWSGHIHPLDYELSWRLVTNSGQEPDLIRPVFGAKGLPYYPGSSMKGAFAQACTDDQRRKFYCGEEITENGITKTRPGILRFHGGYPIDDSWTDSKTLLDVIHPQQERQVEGRGDASAKKQISLHQIIISFGISSTEPDKTDWDEVQAIWEKALMAGIGARTSAGYGQIAYRIEGDKKKPLTVTKQPLLSVYLSAQGIASQLLNGEREFRPNMFKAALRGHTLRLFAGVTDRETAKQVTTQLWGGINEGGSEAAAIVGQLGIQFLLEPGVGQINYDLHKYQYRNQQGDLRNAKPISIYRLETGRLNLFRQDVKDPILEADLENLASNLVKFSLLLGGFGKSWRRVDHKKFSHNTHLPDYFENNDKPTIGCHWEFAEESYDFYLNTLNWEKCISDFLNNLHQKINTWLISRKLPRNGYEKTWREAWHPENVQVWGRLANGENDSLAIAYFHRDYTPGQSIKKKFAGSLGKFGRLWHRMYPQYIQVDGEWQATDKYIELLTIFPRYENVNDPDKQIADQFVQFLAKDQQFTKLWSY